MSGIIAFAEHERDYEEKEKTGRRKGDTNVNEKCVQLCAMHMGVLSAVYIYIRQFILLIGILRLFNFNAQIVVRFIGHVYKNSAAFRFIYTSRERD